MEFVLFLVGVGFILWGNSLHRQTEHLQKWADFERVIHNFKWSEEFQEEADRCDSWASVCDSIGGASIFISFALLLLA